MINAVPPRSALMKESRQQNISAGFATNEIAVLAVLSFIYCCKILLMFYNGLGMFSAELQTNKFDIMTNFEIELYDNYTRCSALNIPDVSTRLYYPIMHLERFKEGELIEIDDKNILALIYGVGRFKDKIENFWTKNEC